jgi:Aldehyde dehydrogenase family
MLIAGGAGRPDGFTKGYFVKPTVFADVSNDMTIAREKIFGPALCIIPYEDDRDAVRIANDALRSVRLCNRWRRRSSAPNRQANSSRQRSPQRCRGRLRRLLWRLQTIGQRSGMG